MAYVSALLTILRFERSFSAAILGVDVVCENECLTRYRCTEMGEHWKKVKKPNPKRINYATRGAFARFLVFIVRSLRGRERSLCR